MLAHTICIYTAKKKKKKVCTRYLTLEFFSYLGNHSFFLMKKYEIRSKTGNR